MIKTKNIQVRLEQNHPLLIVKEFYWEAIQCHWRHWAPTLNEWLQFGSPFWEIGLTPILQMRKPWWSDSDWEVRVDSNPVIPEPVVQALSYRWVMGISVLKAGMRNTGSTRRSVKMKEFPNSQHPDFRFSWEISQHLFSYFCFHIKTFPALYKKHTGPYLPRSYSGVPPRV